MIHKTMIKKGALRSPAMIDKPENKILSLEKGFKRKKINEEIFDLEDSVADNAKMISLLMMVVSDIYGVLNEDQKQNIKNKEIIEEVIENFSGLFKERVNENNTALGIIDKLSTRQKEINKII